MAIVKRDPYKLIGTTLDRYLIQEVAGGGGMGIVYRAQHEITKGTVAIKVLRPDSSLSDQTGISMFFEEAIKTVQLNHPYIVKVIGADYTPEGLAFMVMEWLDGQTLSDELQQCGTMPMGRVANLLEQICDAVAFAHKNNIIHRDLKPGNIMLVRDIHGEEAIRVLDFGIAKVMANTVGTNTRIAGSYYYISPEQTIAQGRIDLGTDIYSLGVMLYQMLTGKVPFDADTDGQIIDMHRTLDPIPLRHINPDIPIGIEEIVLKAMAKRSADRYQSATEMARAFRQAAQLATGAIILQCLDQEDNSPVTTATIYLNGKHAGQTGEKGFWQQGSLTPRKYLIEVDAPKYVRLNLSENLAAHEELTIPILLKRQQTGELIISSSVPNAEVEFDGKRVGRTDQTGRLYLGSLESGQHSIKLTHPGFIPSERFFEIITWQQSFLDIPLVERPRYQLAKQVWSKVKNLSGRLNTSLNSISSGQSNRESDTTEDTVRKQAVEIANKDLLIRGASGVNDKADSPLSFTGDLYLLSVCNNCGMQVSTSLKFCIECGSSLFHNENASIDVSEPGKQTLLDDYLIILTDSFGTKDGEKKAFNTAISKITPFDDSDSSLPYATLSSLREPKTISRYKLLALILMAVVMLLVAITWVKPEIFSIVGNNNHNPRQPENILPPEQSINSKITEIEGMFYIPGGEYQMGLPDAQEGLNDWPQHRVKLEPFYIDKYEVTRIQYQEYLNATTQPLINIRAGTEDWPITEVTWGEANSYLIWKSKQKAEWAGLRLPTEEQWEFVARDGGKSQDYPWGNADPEKETDRANTGRRSKTLMPVGSYKKGVGDEFKVYDLIGNVWEWMDNDYKLYDGNNSKPPENGFKVIRGGRCGDRPVNAYYRGMIRPDERLPYTGFRAVKPAKP